MSRKHNREAIEQNGATLQKSDSKRRTYTGHDMELAQVYDHLTSDDKETRITAAMKIVKICDTLGQNLAATKVNGEWIVPQAESLAITFPDHRKIYVRLIRGLCSNRKSARSGFSGALIEVLRLTMDHHYSKVPNGLEEKVREFVELIEKYTQPQGSVSGQVTDTAL